MSANRYRPLSPPVCDPANRIVYLAAAKCHDCVFNGPGKRLDLAPGRLKALVDEIRAKRGYLPCHGTYAPLGEPVAPGTPPYPGGYSAICRGFADANADVCDALIIGTLLGSVVEVDVPGPRRVGDDPA